MLHNGYDVPPDMLHKQRLREARIQGVDYLILCLAGICLETDT
jgi:hypothetical protein